MKEDKIIRTISEIDDAYILEAAPDQPSMRYRRRFFTGRVIGITAAAAAAVWFVKHPKADTDENGEA